jgi:DNA-binding response OmpR family regulator
MTKAADKPVQNHPSRINVLLVDDDEFTHETMRAFLRDSEFSLLSAFNAAGAMEQILGDKPPDIVITDVMMPGESGFSLIEKLKANPRSAGIPILLLTILTGPDGSVMDGSGKADILIAKPVGASEILESLKLAKQRIAQRSKTADEVTLSFDSLPEDRIHVTF